MRIDKQKIGLLLLIALLPVSGLYAQQPNSQVNGAIIVTLPDTINLGEVYLDEVNNDLGRVQFSIRNAGARPLILNKVSGCCGTNVKQWTHAPILPGKESTVKVEFYPEFKVQTIHRQITIESNATNARKKIVHIVGIITQRKQGTEIVL